MTTPELRPICPNNNNHDSTPNNTNNNNKRITPDTTSSNTAPTAPPDKKAGKANNATKKRRQPLSITTNACKLCKKARQKCDGEKPCGRCNGKRIPPDHCVYEPHTKNVKILLVNDLKESHAIKHMAENIFKCLAENTDNEHEREILERIKKKDSIPSIAQWLESIDADAGSQQSAFGDSDNEAENDPSGFPISWTTITDDYKVTDHLIALYFTWVHPFHPLFDEGHFIKSMRDGSHAFCSHSLFNAICAMACYLHTSGENDDVDYKEMGVQFCDFVRGSINPEDKSLTNIQAFAVMFLVLCAQGQGLIGSAYLKVASRSMESLRPRDNDDADYRQIWRETVRGINSLNVEWAQITFKVAPAFIPELQPTQFADEIKSWEDEVDQLSWKVYRVPDDFTGEPTWRCLTATTNREKSKLIDIIHDATILLYDTNNSPIYAGDMLTIYRRLLTWRENLPEKIASTGRKDLQMLPHVLSLHILYATTAVQLLRPILNLEVSLVGPLVWQHAQEGLSLIDDRYRFQYTCRYQPVSQIFAILYLTEVLVQSFPEADREFGRDGMTSIKLTTDILTESRSGFFVAGVLMTMFQETIRKTVVPLPNELNDLFHRRSRTPTFFLDDALNACSNSTYAQPVEAIVKRLSPNFRSDWMAHAAAGFPRIPYGISMLPQDSELSQEEMGAQNLMRILNLRSTK
ncbi:hypothetical protein NHQ30_001429 [Ciborinia camelliae]|nr:hypothetical protein NHQ30_001429 [Ciborinia camelliae]